MRAIMITLKLYWFYLIYKGIKTLEIRKTMPRNFKGIVYACVSKTNWKKDLMKIPEEERELFAQFVGKVGLKFTLNTVESINCYWTHCSGYTYQTKSYSQIGIIAYSCLSYEKLYFYLNGNKKSGYAWHIDNCIVFDKPKEIRDFSVYSHKVDGIGYNGEEKTFRILKPLTRAPQNYCYIEV